MSGNIEKGCWAMIYRPAPCCGKWYGHVPTIFVVEEITTLGRILRCHCGATYPYPIVVVGAMGKEHSTIIECVKRLPDPPADSADQSTTHEKDRELSE